MENDDKIIFTFVGSQEAGTLEQNIQYQKALINVEKELSSLNMNRGGRETSGFVFENLHNSSKNRSNMQNLNGEVLNVIDDNGIADFKMVDSAGNVSYQQAKMGYHGSNKYKITSEKYDGQVLVVDKGNKELIDYGQKIGLQVEESSISKETADSLTQVMRKEATIRQELGLSNTAPITTKMYMLSEQLKNAHVRGMESAKGAAALAAGISLGKNMYEFIEGNIELRELLINTAKETVIAAGSGYVAGSVGYLASGVLANPVVEGVAAQATSVILSTEIGATLVSIGPIIATVSTAAGPLFVLGMALGTGYTAIKSIKRNADKYRKRMSEINRVLDQTLISMKKAYDDLDETIRSTYDFWNESFDQGFNSMLKAIKDNDFNEFSAGLDIVLNIFDGNVLFRTMEEFDEFFFDDEAVLNM
jgi:hypothetical protein